jgi:hypothetical protein
LYRIFTIVSLFCQTKTSLANARSYLLVSFMVIALFVLSTTIAFSRPAKADGNGTVVVIQNLGQASILLGAALAILLPWWLILTRSRKVKEFESKWLRRIRPGKLADAGPTGADVAPHRWKRNRDSMPVGGRTVGALAASPGSGGLVDQRRTNTVSLRPANNLIVHDAWFYPEDTLYLLQFERSQRNVLHDAALLAGTRPCHIRTIVEPPGEMKLTGIMGNVASIAQASLPIFGTPREECGMK